MQNNNGTTPGSTADAKKAIRREKISARKSLTAEYRRAADQAVCRNLAEIAGDFQGNVLVGYVTDGTEPDVNAVMQTHLDHGGILCVPRFESATDYRIVTVKDLHFTSSIWGIPEPDASAPETDAALLKKLYEAALPCAGSLPGKAVTDTLWKSEDGVLISRVEREGVFAVETPQLFHIAEWKKAVAEFPEADFTDDASLLRHAGMQVAMVINPEPNIKLTIPADLAVLREII